jgi:hypothetical protein
LLFVGGKCRHFRVSAAEFDDLQRTRVMIHEVRMLVAGLEMDDLRGYRAAARF